MVKEEEILCIRLFGGASITIGPSANDTHDPLRFKSQRAELMLAYLALNPYVHQRESLATFLWDDRSQEQSLANLRALLARLPKQVKSYLTLTRQTITLNMEQVWLDVAVFEEALDSIPDDGVLTSAQADTLEMISELANGRFATGLTVKDSLGLDEWVTLTREQLQQQQILLAQRLALYYLHQRDYPNAIRHAQTLVNTDSLREDSYRLLMRALAKNGQRTAAIKQYQLCQKMLANEFGLEPTPATNALYQRIRTAPANMRHHLPAQPTRFIGRDSERLKLHRWLDTPDQHLITIMGLGGAGKTRVAVKVADERRGDYLHGIFFIGFAEAENGRQFFLTLARTLGVRLTQQNIAQQLKQFLQDKEMLLILDNLEQLLEQKEVIQFVNQLLQEAPDIRLIVTSRERLHLRAEWVLPLAGLANEGQILFRERAEQITGEPLTDQNAIREVCDLVDNLPLGIELAASALTRHSLTEIVAQIQQNLDILTTQYHDMPDRHRSIRAAFAYSWQLLSVEEQTILQRLALFRGGFSETSAKPVAHVSTGQLKELAGKSLLRAQEKRYTMHPLLQQFIRDGIQDSTAIRQSHARYFLEFLANKESDLKGSLQAETLTQLSEDTENIRLAWRTAIEYGEAEWLYEAIPAFAMWHMMRSWYRTGYDLMNLLANHEWDMAYHYRFLIHRATFAFIMVEYDKATQMLNESIEHLPKNHADLAVAYNFLGEIARWQSEYELAIRYYEMARPIAEQHNDVWNAVYAIGSIGVSLGHLGDQSAMLAHNLTAVQRLPKGEVWQRGGASITLGITKYRSGHYDEAQAIFEESIQPALQMGDHARAAMWWIYLGIMADIRGEYNQAMKQLDEAFRLYAWVGDAHGVMSINLYMGWVKTHMGQLLEAEQLLQEAWQLVQELDNQKNEVVIRLVQSELCLLQGNLADAETNSRAGLAVSEQISDERGKARSYWMLGLIMVRKGVYPLAQTYLDNANAILQTLPDHWAQISIWCTEGEIALANGRSKHARQQFLQAIQQAKQATPLALRALCGLAQLDKQSEWLHLILQHPASTADTRQQATALLNTDKQITISNPQARLNEILTTLT